METLAPNCGRKAPPDGTPLSDPGAYPELRLEMDRKNFVRAAAIATSVGLPADELRKIQGEALWEMAVNRNAPGTKRLAQQYGISRRTLQQILERRARELRADGHDKTLAACYDAGTGKYLSFEEWTSRLIETWDK